VGVVERVAGGQQDPAGALLPDVEQGLVGEQGAGAGQDERAAAHALGDLAVAVVLHPLQEAQRARAGAAGEGAADTADAGGEVVGGDLDEARGQGGVGVHHQHRVVPTGR
jgi:hypothetical protein